MRIVQSLRNKNTKVGPIQDHQEHSGCDATIIRGNEPKSTGIVCEIDTGDPASVAGQSNRSSCDIIIDGSDIQQGNLETMLKKVHSIIDNFRAWERR